MGEAKRRKAALDAGTPWPRRRVCPVRTCRSPRISDLPADDDLSQLVANAWGNSVVCPLSICQECRAIWEPWPAETPEDCVERARRNGPCDNCAYRAGSGESLDRARWATLRSLPRRVKEDFGTAPLSSSSWFCCHKGIPIVIDPDSDEPIRFDFEAAGIHPHEQTCAGFLLALSATL